MANYRGRIWAVGPHLLFSLLLILAVCLSCTDSSGSLVTDLEQSVMPMPDSRRDRMCVDCFAKSEASASLGGRGFQNAMRAAESKSLRDGSTASGAISVLDPPHNAICNGVADDTEAIASAIASATGRTVYFPGGVECIIRSLSLSGNVDIQMADNAVLRHAAGSVDHMLKFDGESLRIRGGRIHGNRLAQQGRRLYILHTEIPTGSSVEIGRVRFEGIAAAGVYARNFGGILSIENSRFSDIAQHDGVDGHWTAAVYIESGQPGARGLMRFNHNVVIGTDTPDLPGGSPGGLFFAPTLDYHGGIGNFSTLEAIGNYFWGVGQHCAVNDIAPIHTYPATNGARVIGNYFEESGFSAIAAKSVQNFVCIGNVIVNGQTSSRNTATEGAISYAPGYHSGAASRPRAVISGNIVDSPGGQPDTKQDCIAVLGTPQSRASDVVIADNVLSGCGNAVQVRYADDIDIRGNRLHGSTGGRAGVEIGIRLAEVGGAVKIADNLINVPNGHGIHAPSRVGAAEFMIENNYIRHTSSYTYGVVIRGALLAKFSGNVIDSTSSAISIGGDGTNPLGTLHWDLSNSIMSGQVHLAFEQILQAGGHIVYSRPPGGLVRAPPGTLYTLLKDGRASVYLKEDGTDALGWVER